MKDKERNIKESTHIALYIDFLGASEKICSKESAESLSTIMKIYDDMIKILTEKEMSSEDIKFSLFSDNVVFAREIKNTTDKPFILYQFIVIASFFQIYSLAHNWLIRGGIVIDNLYISDIVWGKALVRAHHLEDKLAIYPRIVIDPALSSFLDDNKDRIYGWYYDLGLPIVDYLSVVSDKQTLSVVRDSITRYIENTNGEKQKKIKESVQVKIAWIINNYNRRCVQLGLNDCVLV